MLIFNKWRWVDEKNVYLCDMPDICISSKSGDICPKSGEDASPSPPVNTLTLVLVALIHFTFRNSYIVTGAALQIHDRSPTSRPVASLNQSQTQMTRPVAIGLGMQRALWMCSQAINNNNCCARFVNLRNSQNALRNFESAREFANFLHKPDPNPP